MALYIVNHRHGCGCEEIEADSAEQAIAICASQLTEREADYEMYAVRIEDEEDEEDEEDCTVDMP